VQITQSELRFYQSTAIPHRRYGMLTYTHRSIDPDKLIALCDCGRTALVCKRAKSCGCLVATVSSAAGVAKRRKLTDSDVAPIRSSSERGTVLAARYGVSESTISSVRVGRRYKSI
jgi:hypothetical protein